MNSPAYTITDSAVVLMIDGRTYTVKQGDDRFSEVKDAIRTENFDLIPSLLDIKGKLISDSNGGLYLLNGVLRCDKYDIPSLLASRIIKMFKEGFSIDPLTKFLENLMKNPSKSSRDELYGFIEACDLPITADGHFLAYKMVRSDFKDIYSGTMDNSVGTVVEMSRERVDDNRHQTCSSGLHFCSEGYLGCYGTRGSDQVVIVKINPRDVVSIPVDYNNAKGRACRYEVVDAISWDDVITPLFTDEYSDVDDFDESGYDMGNEYPDEDWFGDHKDWTDDTGTSYRWEVYTASGNYVTEFKSRQQARDHVHRLGGTVHAFVWDTENEEVDIGNAPQGWSPEKDSVAPSAGVKLNATVVAEIRRRLDSYDYDSYAGLAREYGVSDRTIRRIRDRESWVGVY